VWALELSLGLELYACAVLALHARGLRATPLEASAALVLPALVIPPVFYVLVALVIVRPLSRAPLIGAAVTMCGLHGMLVAATGALFMIPDLVDYGAAVAFALWGSPAVTLLQLTAAPLVFARLRPLVSAQNQARGEPRAAGPRRRVEPPAPGASSRPLAPVEGSLTAFHASAPSSTAPAHGGHRAATPAPAPPAFVSPVRATAGHSAPLAPAAPPAVIGQPAVAPPSAAVDQPVVKASPSVGALPPKSPVAPPAEPGPVSATSRRALEWTEPSIRVSFVRIADQLPVEMFARGAEGLKDTMRPGVSLLVPRALLLPHLGEGLAPVKWEVVADQFPLDELAMTHEEIADRLPDGSLLLPLDEVIPQIPPELLMLSTPPLDVHQIEEFPEPFQPHAPVPPAADPAIEASPTPAASVDLAETGVNESAEEEKEDAEAPELAVAGVDDRQQADAAPQVEETEPVEEGAEPEESETFAAPREVDAPAARATTSSLTAPEPPSTGEHTKGGPARRIAALLTPLVSGLEIGQRGGAGTTLVTVIAPTLDEDSVVRSAMRIVPFLGDARLPERLIQVTLAAAGVTVVLTPFGSSEAGGALLVTAVASRAGLAWLERLSRTAAREAPVEAANGQHAEARNGAGEQRELSATDVPPAVHELASSLTAFGAVGATMLRDRAGALSACLFLPRSLDAMPLARFAHDIYEVLAGAEIGPVTSVILKLGGHRVVLRAMDGAAGHVTMLVGGGRIDRPGLARIELDRAASRLGALVEG
jgi:hypothetical protein